MGSSKYGTVIYFLGFGNFIRRILFIILIRVSEFGMGVDFLCMMDIFIVWVRTMEKRMEDEFIFLRWKDLRSGIIKRWKFFRVLRSLKKVVMSGMVFVIIISMCNK